MSKIVLNTLALINAMKAETKKQQDYFEGLSDIGISVVEVRREFFQNPMAEAADVLAKADKNGLSLYYSVPAPLYSEKKLAKESLLQFLAEAKAMKITRVKVIIGDAGKVSKDDLQWLEANYLNAGVQLSVENDQTQENGRIQKISQFLEQCNQVAPKIIDTTFDIGNWIYTGDDPMDAAKKLSPFVGFIHLKDVKKSQPPETCLLGEGDILWKDLFRDLPKDVPVAIEYPCGVNATSTIAKEVEKIREVLQ